MPPTNRRSPRFRRGAAAAEFALVLPIFLTLTFGMIELGRVIMVHQILTNGAREGARYAIVPGRTQAQVETVVTNYFSKTLGLAAGDYSRQIPNPATITSGAPVEVSVSVAYSKISWGTNWLGLGGKTLSATVVMRRE